jgi:HAMP domain-containing protein
MKLLAKFSLVFVLVFGLGLAAAAWLSFGFLRENAHEQVRYQAQVMMDGAAAIRHYTDKKVGPAIKAGKPNEFRPETVPAFAAIEIFDYLRKSNPDYSYREATLNPTNLRDRAVEWEVDVIRQFRDRSTPDAERFVGERMTPAGRSVYLASPIRAAKSCLECHSTPDVAPASMLAQYGRANGFGWQENEIVGAQIVTVPATLPDQMAAAAFRHFVWSLGAVGAAMFLALNVTLYFVVIRPVRRFAEGADRISRGDVDGPELSVRGRDEIAVLAGSFKRMHRSLATAMKMIDPP